MSNGEGGKEEKMEKDVKSGEWSLREWEGEGGRRYRWKKSRKVEKFHGLGPEQVKVGLGLFIILAGLNGVYSY